MSTRRKRLEEIKLDSDPGANTMHAGLWLDRFLKQHARTDADAHDAATKKDTEAKATLVNEVCSIRPPEVYAAWFQHWSKKLEQHASIIGEATTLAPLVVGLGSASVLETSLSLHRTFGVPFIPGSALKGLTAAFTRRRVADWGEWSKGNPHSYEPGEAYTIAFGTQQSAGYVSFYDALWIPGAAPLHREVMTPHHPQYQTGSLAPTDFDSPTPVPFISAAGSFLVALGGPVEWTQRIFEILTLALAEEGVGAKTSSGYGRMRLEQRKS